MFEHNGMQQSIAECKSAVATAKANHGGDGSPMGEAVERRCSCDPKEKKLVSYALDCPDECPY